MLVLLEELIHMYVHHVQIDNVIEAHCYVLQCRRIDCEQIHSRINQQLIAGRFGCVQNSDRCLFTLVITSDRLCIIHDL